MIPDWFVFLHFIYVRVHFFARVPVFFVRFFAYQLLPASKCTNLTSTGHKSLGFFLCKLQPAITLRSLVRFGRITYGFHVFFGALRVANCRRRFGRRFSKKCLLHTEIGIFSYKSTCHALLLRVGNYFSQLSFLYAHTFF